MELLLAEVNDSVCIFCFALCYLALTAKAICDSFVRVTLTFADKLL